MCPKHGLKVELQTAVSRVEMKIVLAPIMRSQSQKEMLASLKTKTKQKISKISVQNIVQNLLWEMLQSVKHLHLYSEERIWICHLTKDEECEVPQLRVCERYYYRYGIFFVSNIHKSPRLVLWQLMHWKWYRSISLQWKGIKTA